MIRISTKALLITGEILVLVGVLELGQLHQGLGGSL
jgi:hypothetical protein